MSPRRPSAFPFRAGALAAAAALLVIAAYTLYAALPYLMGPGLSVRETTTDGLTTIVGTTARVSYLSIDGGPVALQEDGSFSAVRAYPPGYTVLTVSVKDRFGRSKTKTLAFLNN